MDMSNKTLAFFLVAAIIVSIAGTMISLNKLNQYQQLAGSTGLATSGTGNVSLVVSKIASITFLNATIDWGTGSVNSSNTNCTMETNGTGYNTPGCVGFNTVNDGLILQNNGNLDVNVTLNFSNNETIFGGSDNLNRSMQFNITRTEDSSCNDSGVATLIWNNITDAWKAGGGQLICGNFTWDDPQDTIEINFKIAIPVDSATGSMSTNITAQASQISAYS